ncbi:MAG TPA: LysR family transcriptional regulator [Xanthobacteraceae bacterium]|nr:LysR family transcriptional regulator [Xanthobacteraceae bacterium]
MDIDEIRTFVSIAQLGGFTRAAGRLNRSQPTISRRIGLIEQDLGAPLVERVRGGAKLTEAGRAFLPFAEAVLAAIEDGREAVRATIGEGRGDVSLALVGTLADTHIVEVLRQFARRSRGGGKSINLDLRTASSQEVSDLVRRGEATLGLRYFDSPHPDLVSQTVGREDLLVICAADHPLAGRRVTAARQLRGERWVAFPAARGRESFGGVLERQLVVAGLDGAAVTLIDSLTAQKRLVEAGFGIALVPASSVRDELRLGAVKTLDAPALRTAVPVMLIHRRKGYLSAAARALLALMSSTSLQLKRAKRRPSPRGRAASRPPAT